MINERVSSTTNNMGIEKYNRLSRENISVYWRKTKSIWGTRH